MMSAKKKHTPDHKNQSSTTSHDVRLLYALNAAAAALQKSTQSQAEVLRAFREKIVGFDLRGSISLLDEKGEHFVLRAVILPGRVLTQLEEMVGLKVEGFEFSTTEVNVYRQVLETSQAVFVADSSTVIIDMLPKIAQPFADAILKTVGNTPAIYAPLTVGGHVKGVLDISTAELTSQSIPAVEAFANHISIALENARLYQAERARRQELETIQHLGLSLTASLELNQVLEGIVRAAFNLVSAGNVDIFLYSDGHLIFGADIREDGSIRGPFAEPRPAGLTYTVARRGEPIIVPDIRAHPLFEDAPSEWEGAIVGFPLKIGERVVGVMNVARPSVGPFSDTELRGLSLLADQAAIAIENARLYQAERARYREAEALRRAALALTSTMSLDQVIERLLAELQQVIPYDSASVQLLKGDKLEIIGGRGFPNPSEILGLTFPVRGDNPNALVIDSREPVIIDDVRQHYSAFSEDPHAVLNVRGWIGVPLLIGDQVIGMLALDKHEPGFYIQAHGKVAMAYAAQAAVAIENARLHVETERRAEHLAVLHELDQAVTASLRITDVYHAFARHTARLLPYDRMSITLVEGDTVRVAFTTGEGDQGPPVGTELSLKMSAMGQAIIQGQAALRHDMTVDVHFTEYEPLIPDDIRSSMIIPLRVKGQVIGTWNIGSRQADAYSPDDLEIADSMADQLAIAVENAHLYEDLEARMAALQETQARLVQSEKLAAIGELVAGVAHELNNPLTSIIGFAQLLQHSNVSGEAREDLDKIVSQGQRVANIVRNLLDFARQRPLEKKPTQVNDVLNSTLDLLAYELRTHNVECTIRLSPNLPSTMVDPHRLQQVFINLINNAHYAMTKAHGGGHLTVTTELAAALHADPPDDNSVIRITIHDDGPGIPLDALPRIFDPFYTTKPQGDGTGLGLSVCHGIVKEHNGHIWVESDPEKGTSFFIDLPVAGPLDSSQFSPSKPQEDSHHTARILIIDDEVNVLDVLTRALEKESYRVDAIDNGEGALARIATTHYDLILCDVRMPGMNGMEVYRQIEERDPQLAHRVIFITGDTIRPTTRRFLEESGSSFLSKPFNMTNLVETVRSTIARLEGKAAQ